MQQPPAEDAAVVPEPQSGEAAASSPDASAASEDSYSSSGKRKSIFRRVAEHLSWTEPQRRGLIVVLFMVFMVLAWRAIRDRAFVANPQSPAGQRALELDNRLDPNTATWEELAALPQLGEKRARAIVEHRDEWHKWHPNELAFKEPLDLVAVKGIGGSMVDNLSPFLTFPPAPPEAPATQAATKPSRKAKVNAK